MVNGEGACKYCYGYKVVSTRMVLVRLRGGGGDGDNYDE